MVETLIVGAGPAGLAIAARLQEAGRAFSLLEKADSVASSWHGHYDRLHLHTDKSFSHLPFAPFPDTATRYVSRSDLIAYFCEYQKRFDIEPEFNQDVQSIRKVDDAWQLSTASGRNFETKHLVMATGFNRIPVQPHFEGEGTFRGSILHSRSYKNAEPYVGKRVLVVGMGNTGAEIALDLAESGVTTFLSVRDKVNIIPRDFLGNSTQKTALLLAKLPNVLGDNLGVLVRQLSFGNLESYGLTYPEIAPAAQLRKFGKTPVIDLGTVAKIKDGSIKVMPAIKSFNVSEICFANDDCLAIDHVILATGYTSALQDLLRHPDSVSFYNELGQPKAWKAKDNLYFLGFNAYSTGGLLKSIHDESELITKAILA